MPCNGFLTCPPSQASHEFGTPDSQCLGNPKYVEQAKVALAPLDTADIRAVQPTLGREGFLRKPSRFAQHTYAFTETPDVPRNVSHDKMLTGKKT